MERGREMNGGDREQGVKLERDGRKDGGKERGRESEQDTLCIIHMFPARVEMVARLRNTASISGSLSKMDKHKQQLSVEGVGKCALNLRKNVLHGALLTV